jgi:hypothetical protein
MPIAGSTGAPCNRHMKPFPLLTTAQRSKFQSAQAGRLPGYQSDHQGTPQQTER